MKSIKKFLIFLSILYFIISIGIGRLSYAQPKIPKENIPSGISPKVRKQIERLYSPDPIQRIYGAACLGKMGKQAVPAIPYLIDLFDDNTPTISKPLQSLMREYSGFFHNTPGVEAARALVKIGKPAVEPLIAALNNKDSSVRNKAVLALGKIKDDRAVEALIMTLKDEYRRFTVIGALKTSGELAVGPLIIALTNEDSLVREGAAIALGKIEDKRAIEPLIDILKDESPTVRKWGALALGDIKDKRAVEPLIMLLNDEDLDVRWGAITALGEIKNRQAVGALIGILKDEDSAVRHKAAWALEEITGKRFGENITKWQEWWEKNKHNFNKN